MVLSAVRLKKQTGGSAMKMPEKKPNNKACTTIPPRLVTAMLQKTRMLQMKAPGMMTLRGPILSERMFGRVRPNTEPAFRMGTR